MNDILKKRYQVFVSSTYGDLVDERKHVIQALLETKCIPAGMELFPAASEDQWTLIKHVIDDCDYYLVIVAGKYGSLGATGKSYTEMEFDYAVESGKPVLGFFHEDLDTLPGAKLEKSDRLRKQLAAFTAKVKTRICRPWSTKDGLASAIKSAMLYAIENHPRPGWVRADSVPDRDLVERLKSHIEELEKRNQEPKRTRPGVEGKTNLEIPVSISYSKWTDGQHKNWSWFKTTQTVTATLEEIFLILGPRLLKKRSRVGLKKILNHWTDTRLQESLVEVAHDMLHSFSTDVDRETFDRLLDTLVANKLLRRVQPPSHVYTKEFYWQLTPMGMQRLSELRTAHERLRS